MDWPIMPRALQLCCIICVVVALLLFLPISNWIWCMLATYNKHAHEPTNQPTRCTVGSMNFIRRIHNLFFMFHSWMTFFNGIRTPSVEHLNSQAIYGGIAMTYNYEVWWEQIEKNPLTATLTNQNKFQFCTHTHRSVWFSNMVTVQCAMNMCITSKFKFVPLYFTGRMI